MVDEEALELRETGASYSAIARRLELRRAIDAHGAFVRALRVRSGDERQQMVVREQGRLDSLEVRIRERDATEPEKLARRLAALETLRVPLR